MISVMIIHLVVRWSWVVSMSSRMWNELTSKPRKKFVNNRMNLILNMVVAGRFIFSAINGASLEKVSI
jgi:hypothetical protein